MALRLEIERAINRASREDRSNTPDYILAEYLVRCLDAFEKATNQRTEWYWYNAEDDKEVSGGQ